MIAEAIPNVEQDTLRRATLRNVEPGSTVSTDELYSYGLLEGSGYKHGVVRHGRKEYARGEHHTNHVESFWNLFKNSVRSTHIHISSRYMDCYLGEFTFRSNRRAMAGAMFDLLIASV